jgi:hypothetical protein
MSADSFCFPLVDEERVRLVVVIERVDGAEAEDEVVSWVCWARRALERVTGADEDDAGVVELVTCAAELGLLIGQK